MPLQPDPLKIPSHARTFDRVKVDQYASSLLHSREANLLSALSAANKACEDAHLPEWTTIPSQGRFLQLQCRMLRVQQVLELGTLGGHSAIWCAAANDSLRVTTIEHNSKFADVAAQNIHTAGIADRVELIRGDAYAVLPTLEADIRNGKRERYGLILVDVDAMEGLWNLLDRVLALGGSGTCILAHCAVTPSNPEVPSAQESNPRVRGSRVMLEEIAKDSRLDAGLLMCSGEVDYDLLVATIC